MDRFDLRVYLDDEETPKDPIKPLEKFGAPTFVAEDQTLSMGQMGLATNGAQNAHFDLIHFMPRPCTKSEERKDFKVYGPECGRYFETYTVPPAENWDIIDPPENLIIDGPSKWVHSTSTDRT